MDIRRIACPAFGLVGLLVASSAFADWRCDCSQITASCSARVAIAGNGITVSSDHKACSRVDYLVEGQPFVTLAVDGEGKEAWLPQTSQPHVVVTSCQVCRDRLLGGGTPEVSRDASTAPGADSAEASPADAVVKFDPVYPEAAKARGLDGYVTVKLRVNAAGIVERAEVLEANPARVFDQAALAAVRRWRYIPRAPESGDREIVERVVFRLPRGKAAGRSADQFRFNECIRVAGGEVVGGREEVQLENTCDQPLLVHSCTEGSDGRWDCGPWEGRRTLLVRAGDARAGSSISFYADDGQQSFVYAERLARYRPPNTRYWWLACEAHDTACNSAATGWRSIHEGRPTSVDPGSSELAKVASAR